MERDPYKYFRIEARELLDGLSQGILDLEKGTGAPGPVLTHIFRLAHTLKGAARVVKKNEIAVLAHALEDALEPHRQSQKLPHGVFGPLLDVLDHMRRELATLDPQIEAIQHHQMQQPHLVESTRVELEEVDGVLEGVFEAGVRLHDLRTEIAHLEQTQRLADLVLDQLNPRFTATAAVALERTHSLADELRTHLSRAKRRINTGLERLESDLSSVRERTSRLRLIAAKGVSASLERAVRDGAYLLQKRANFSSTGGEAKLDAHVLAAVQDALLHIVRNAIAHGVESETARIEAGKKPTGQISLHIERHGDQIRFRCQDDGRGLDVAAIRQSALKRGWITTAEMAAFGMREAIEMIRRNGLTTSAAADAMSGRGVGLDVAAEVAERLKGELRITSQAGIGTTVELSVPVNLTAVDALFAHGAGCDIAVPSDSVDRVVNLGPGEVVMSPFGNTVQISGERFSCIGLSELMHPGGTETFESGPAIVLRAGNARAVLGVKRLLGTANVVIRPLPPAAAGPLFIAGATLGHDGTPQLVLDPAGVIAAAESHRSPRGAHQTATPNPLLIIDDSLTTRMLEQSILESAGYKVETASSAEEGFAMAQAKRYALFLVDVEMPGWNGFEFLAHTRGVPALADIPAIMVTSRSSPEDRLQAERVGAKAYIVKGEFDQVRLLDTIRTLLE